MIIDAARELFATRGYDAVTMRMIAQKIEYSPTAIYSHFADKAALIRELCDTDFRALARAFGSIARIEDPVERLSRIGEAYVQFAVQYPNHYRVMFMTTHLPDAAEGSSVQLGNPEEDAYAFLRETVAEGIRTGRYRPELTDPELVAQIAWAGVHGVISLHLAKEGDRWVEWRPLTDTARTMVDVIARGLVRTEA